MRVVELSGGVGGARLATGLARVDQVDLTVVVNVGDDERIHGLHVSPDLDTVVYTLAGAQGPEGWGRSEDTFSVNDELARFGVDNTFLLGDRDLALNIFRTQALDNGAPLSEITLEISKSFGVEATIVPVSNDAIRTKVRTADGEWLGFQEYFVLRRNRDEVAEVVYRGAESATPTPGVVDAIADAEEVIIGPSNPPLSIWPILAVTEVREAVAAHPSVSAVSPLIRGKALKGPAARVMASLGLPDGTDGVLEAYRGLVDRLYIDSSDAGDVAPDASVEIIATDTLISDPDRAEALGRVMLGL